MTISEWSESSIVPPGGVSSKEGPRKRPKRGSSRLLGPAPACATSHVSLLWASLGRGCESGVLGFVLCLLCFAFHVFLDSKGPKSEGECYLGTYKSFKHV